MDRAQFRDEMRLYGIGISHNFFQTSRELPRKSKKSVKVRLMVKTGAPRLRLSALDLLEHALDRCEEIGLEVDASIVNYDIYDSQ